MLAEVVLRPPDVRHLDAAFQGLAASPRRESSLKVSIGDLFATRCATCARTLAVDEFTWSVDDEAGIAGPARPVLRHYRCTVCRDQRGGGEQRQAPLDATIAERASADVGAGRRARHAARRASRSSTGAEDLLDELLDLHTPRQLVAPGRDHGAHRERPARGAGPRRAASGAPARDPAVEPPGRRPRSRRARCASSAGHVRLPPARQWRERNPWLAFEDAFRRPGVRPASRWRRPRPGPGRLGEDLRSLGEGTGDGGNRVVRVDGLRRCARRSGSYGRAASTPRVRLVLGQPPMRPNLERLAMAYLGTAWVLGREATALLPVDALAGASLRAPWRWQAASIGRALDAVEPAMARDGRVVQLVDGGAGGARGRGRRRGDRRLPRRRRPPGGSRRRRRRGRRAPATGRRPATRRRGPGRTSGSSPCRAAPATRTRPRARACSLPPERFDQRPFSAADAARTVTETAVETLRGPGRARALRAAPRRGPGRARPGRSAPAPGRRDRAADAIPEAAPEPGQTPADRRRPSEARTTPPRPPSSAGDPRAAARARQRPRRGPARADP